MSENFNHDIKTDLSRRALMIGAGFAAAAVATGCADAQTSDAPADLAQETKKSVTKSQAELKAAPPDLTGTSILITGCSSGFGRLGAEHYARLGAKVFATMRNLPRPEAKELEALAKSDDLDITVLEIDVTNDNQVLSGITHAVEMAGKLDVLINNAGISYAGPIEIQDMEATQHLFDTNVFGPQRMARAALPYMRKAGGGYIVNVSSQLGRLIIPGYGMYSPTKFALEAMSEQMAFELASHNVDVTIIQPGGYPTKIWENANALSGKLKARLTDDHFAAYPAMTAGMGAPRAGGAGGTTDPMDIPRSIAEAIAMKPGSRPLRREVHPGSKPQIAVNEVSAKAQLAWLGESPFGAAFWRGYESSAGLGGRGLPVVCQQVWLKLRGVS